MTVSPMVHIGTFEEGPGRSGRIEHERPLLGLENKFITLHLENSVQHFPTVCLGFFSNTGSV